MLLADDNPAYSVLLHTAKAIACGLFLGYILRLYFNFKRVVSEIGHWPGRRVVFGIELLINRFVPQIPGILLGADYSWKERYEVYEIVGWDIHSTISIWPGRTAELWLADSDAIKEVASSRLAFPKPTENYRVLRALGPNIIEAEFDDWKRFRKICAPAFSERNNRHVWDTTILATEHFFSTDGQVWKEEIALDHVTEITIPLALSVVAIAALGRSTDFLDGMDLIPHSSGHCMSFREALDIAAKDMWVKFAVPSWMLGIYPRFRRLRNAFSEVEMYMREMIHERRRTSNLSERPDLMSLLLEANHEAMSDGDASLTDEELLGNLFGFILGGHEGTAHTLCFALAELAMHPEEQDLVYQEAAEVFGDDAPAYEMMTSLKRSLAVVYETLRMFPPVTLIPKCSSQDTTLRTTNRQGNKGVIPVPKGTRVLIHTTALHYNTRYWSDPQVFKPSRFLGEWPKHAFLPFGAGARSCLGRRFFEIESVAALSLIVRKYRISVKTEVQFTNESRCERERRILDCHNILTLTPKRVPLVFNRRQD